MKSFVSVVAAVLAESKSLGEGVMKSFVAGIVIVLVESKRNVATASSYVLVVASPSMLMAQKLRSIVSV